MILLAILLGAQPQWYCEDPGPQQEMNSCAAKDFEAADAALNAQWKKTADEMKRRDREVADPRDRRPGYFATLLDAQRAWLKYRDAHCVTQGYLFRGGTMEPFMVATCKTTMTQARTKQLRDLVEVE